MKKGYEITLKNIVKKELFDQLDSQYKIDLPKSLLENQLKVVENQQGIEKLNQEQKTKLAERMVRCGIIINDIANKNNIKVEKDEFNAKISEILSFIPSKAKIVCRASATIAGEAFHITAPSLVITAGLAPIT